MDVALPKNTFDNLVNYLSKCPFIEVENLVNELRQNVRPVVINPPTETPKEVVDNVQSTEANTTQQAPVEQTGGEETNNQETKPSE